MGETCQPQSVWYNSHASLQACVVSFFSARWVVNKGTKKSRLLYTNRRKSLTSTQWNANLFQKYKYLIFQPCPRLISTFCLTGMMWQVQEKPHASSKSPLWSPIPFVVHLSVTDANEDCVHCLCICLSLGLSERKLQAVSLLDSHGGLKCFFVFF